MKTLFPNNPEPQGLLSISEREWNRAELYFKMHPDEVKLSRKKDNKQELSFVKVNDTIYGVANTKCCENGLLGIGKYSRVKLAQTKSGKMFAVKIEGRAARTLLEDDHIIAEALGFSHGQAERHLLEPKVYRGVETDRKLYTITDYIPGDELFKALYDSPEQTIEPDQFLLLLVKTAMVLLGLHRLGVIHADLKEQNFMANIKGLCILVDAIDFGFSKIIAADKQSIILARVHGTPEYMAPEIKDKAEYSFASDVYALGIMYQKIYEWPFETLESFKKMLDDYEKMPANEIKEDHFEIIASLKESIEYWEKLVDRYREKIDIPLGPIFSAMTADAPSSRPSLEKVINAGLEQLEKRLVEMRENKNPYSDQIAELITQTVFYLQNNDEGLNEKRKKIFFHYEQAKAEQALQGKGETPKLEEKHDKKNPSKKKGK